MNKMSKDIKIKKDQIRKDPSHEKKDVNAVKTNVKIKKVNHLG